MAALLLAAAGPAAAGGWQGGASLAVDLEGERGTLPGDDPAAPARTGEVVTLGESLRGVAGSRWVGLAAAFELRLGGAAPAGFACDVALSPVGLGLLLGQRTRVALVAGGGLSGVTGSVPFGWTVPVEAFGETSLGDHLRLALWARAVTVLGAESRAGGAPDAPFGDELAAGATLRWDRRRDEWGFTSGNGYQLGALYAQRAGASWGLILGYSLDIAGGG